MTILISAFTGYNLRELLLPISALLDRDPAIEQVLVVTPGAKHAAQLFPDLTSKYTFIPEQPDQAGYQKIIKDLRPDLVVTPTAGLEPRDIPLLNAAKKLSVPTLTFIASWDNVYKMERRIKLKKYNQAYALADHFAVWNQMNYDHLLAIAPQLKPANVTITGSPRLDFLADTDHIPPRADLLKRLDLPDDGKKMIHIATTELYSSDYLVSALATLDAHLLVSVHPGGDLDRHLKYAKPYGAKVFYSFGRLAKTPASDFLYAPTLADIKLHAAVFKHADLLINHSSTVTIESIIADTPAINVKYGRPFDWWNWYRSMVYRDFQQHARIIVESGATRVATSRRQLIADARSYLKDPAQDHPARQSLTQKMIHVTDGTAGRRLVELIKQLVQTGT